MEMLISTPVRPLEVMLGKILPYVFVGYVQTLVFLVAAMPVFNVPFEGSWTAFFLGFNLFIVVQPGARIPDFDGGEEPDAGDAAELLHHPARRSSSRASCSRSAIRN